MGKRGPKPKPTATKRFEGNPGKRRLDKREPVAPPPSSLAPPEWLGPIAVEYWQRLAPRLQALRVLTAADVDALAILCDAWQKKHDARTTIATVGAYLFTDSGFCYAHPALAQEAKAIELIRKLNAEFGLTPSSRAYLEVGKSKLPGKLSKYVRDGHAPT